MSQRSGLPITDIAAFIAVAENASFTRASEGLQTSKSNVGKAVQRLESRLGARLFQRTTRTVRLTEDGKIYLEAARNALKGLEDAERALAARRSEPAGRVRLDMPANFGRLFLPSFACLRGRYPKLTLEVTLSDRLSDPVREGLDIIVRIGSLPETGDVTVRKLCDMRLGLYASPEYLAGKGRIDAVQDLREHDAVIFRGQAGRLRPWTLQDAGRKIELAPDPVLILSDGQALMEAAMSGIGIVQILDRVARSHMDAGRLVHVLPGADVEGPSCHAIIPPQGRGLPKTRAVISHLAEVLRS